MSDVEDRFKPFLRSDRPWTLLEIVKTAVLTVTFFPIRLVLLTLPLIIYASITWVAGRLSPRRPDGTVSATRMWIVDTFLPPLIRTMVFAAGIVNLRIEGVPDEGEAVIIVSNHVSWIDMLLFLYIFRRVSVVTKAEVRRIPFLGYCGDCHDNLWIARGQGKGAAEQISDRAKLGVHPGRFRVALFPEGTTSNGNQMLNLHKGAFLPGEPVKPMVLHYPFSNFSPAFESIGGLYHAWRLLTQVYSSLTVTLLPTYHPSEEEKADPELYARNVRQVMADALGVGVSESTLTDKREYERMLRGGGGGSEKKRD